MSGVLLVRTGAWAGGGQGRSSLLSEKQWSVGGRSSKSGCPCPTLNALLGHALWEEGVLSVKVGV
jgi:hypothetical protein